MFIMVTEVCLQRELFGEHISQMSKSEFFSATDLVRAGDKWRVLNGLCVFNLSQYLGLNSTKEFIVELENKYGSCIIKGRGRNANTWVHPLLFIDIALAINSKLKIEVYEWLFDNLIKYRNDSGDSYKEMCAALYTRYSNKRDFQVFITKTANSIKESLGVSDWDTATETQLDKRHTIHNNIKLLSKVLTDPESIVRIGIKESV